jgi:hypothetical protein
MRNKSFLLISICVFLLVGCAGKGATQESDSPVEEGYPVTEVTPPDDSAYPVEEVDLGYKQGPEFHIDLPLTTNDQVVTGTGPTGVPILLVDVSEAGYVIGNTVIGDDGTFSFALEEPLKINHMIGLQLGDIEGTEFEEGDFLYSDTYYERPLIGILFDLVTVE